MNRNLFTKLILLFSISLSSLAFVGSKYNRKGVVIKYDTPAPSEVKHNSGSTTELSGSICVSKYSSIHNKEKCRATLDGNVSIRAYFPDAMTEVTDHLQVTKHGHEYKWTFSTPELSTGTENTLHILVAKEDKRIKKYEKLQAKLNKRILLVEKRIAKLEGRVLTDRLVEWLEQLKSRLERVSKNIDSLVEEDTSVLAQIKVPLQVDNQISFPFYYSSFYSGHKMSLRVPLGSPIEGRSVNVEAKSKNLSEKSFWFPEIDEKNDKHDKSFEDDGLNQYALSLSHKSVEISNTGYIEVSFGNELEINREISSLSISEANSLRLDLLKKLNLDFKGKGKKSEKEFVYGSLDYTIPVAEDLISPKWSHISYEGQNNYFNSDFSINLQAGDDFGDLDTSKSKFELFKVVDGSLTEHALPSINQNVGEDRVLDINIDFNSLADGEYLFKATAFDHAGNATDTLEYTFFWDTVIPEIALNNVERLITNETLFQSDVMVTDKSPTQIDIFNNNQLVSSVEDSLFSGFITLTEGMNNIIVRVMDRAGNVNEVSYPAIELDTIAPELSDISPIHNSIIDLITFPVSFKSSEKLDRVLLNDEEIDISSNRLNISHIFTAEREGDFHLKITAIDYASNETVVEIDAVIILEVLRAELISIKPKENDPYTIVVTGAEWASQPGLEISTGFFGFNSINSDERGRFQIELPIASEVTLKGVDDVYDRTEYVTLRYNIDTTFSGKVQNIHGEPMAGVTVTIINSNQSAITDASGIFSISNPATGDQKVSFDASGINVANEDETYEERYNKTSVAFSLGSNQLNVLSKPITLVPLVIDGNETVVDETTSTTVTNPNVEGFALSVDSGNTVFPDGTETGTISVSKLASEHLNVRPPEYVKPEFVYALEPSGLKFREPANLVLPNDNEFPPKTQLIVYSKNSDTGIWEIDGLSQVSDDGQTVESVENGGITHFSEVFVAPIAPKLSSFSDDAVNEATVGKNGLSLSASIPSMKIAGKDFAPSFVYNSTWANPKLVVSNIISVDKQERKIERTSLGKQRIEGKGFNVSFEGKQWVEPENVWAWASVGDYTSERYPFTGVPNNSVISYALDLKDQKSGYHPYLSEYEIQLKTMTLGTYYLMPTSSALYLLSGEIKQAMSSPDSKLIEELYPYAYSGNVIVQNRSTSEFGKGWKLGINSQILDPKSAVLALESPSGEVKSYYANNQIQTVYTSEEDIFSASFYGSSSYISRTNGEIVELDSNSGEITDNVQTPRFEGTLGYNFVRYEGKYSCGSFGLKKCNRYRCNNRRVDYVQNHVFSKVFKNEEGKFVGADINGALFQIDNSSKEVIVGNVTNMVGVSSGRSSSNSYKNNTCATTGFECSNDVYLSKYNGVSCGTPPASSGQRINSGYVAGDRLSSKFNNITDFISTPFNSLLIVDSGNNVVRSVNMETNQVEIFAGNRQTLDNGDGGLARAASMYHPNGIVADKQGNVYISTENGYIRKVDSAGYITKIAGLNTQDGGKIALSGHALEMALTFPKGMAIDNSKNILYVADSGNNRVLAINLTTLDSYVVAGDGECRATIKENVPATSASLCSPERVALDENNNLLIFDKGHRSIRRVILNTGVNNLAFFTKDNDGTTLERLDNGEIKLTMRDGTQTFFDNNGREYLSQSLIGTTLEYKYQDELLTEVIKDNIKLYDFYYYDGLLDRVVDKAQRETQFVYEDSKLTEIIYPDQTKEKFVYDEAGKIIQSFNKNNFATNYYFDDYDQLVSSESANGAQTSVEVGTSNTVGNGSDETELKDFDDPAIADYIVDAKGNEVAMKKDFTGFVNTITDVKGQTTEIERDSIGRPVSVKRPDGTEVSFVYAGFSNDLIEKYDTATGVRVKYTYNDFGQLLLKTENGDVVEENFYNELGQLVSKKNQIGQTVSYEYNSMGLVSKKTNPDGTFVEYLYSDVGNVLASSDELGNVTDFVRDASGNITSITNAKGQNVLREYDEFNRLLSVTDGNGDKTSYTYSATGQLANILDPNGKVTSFTYDTLDRLIEKVDPLGRVTSLEYDLNNNVTKEVLPNGVIKQYQYNSANELTKKILPDNLYEYAYDSRGNLTMARNNVTQVNFEYEHLEIGDVVNIAGSFGVGERTDLPSLDFEYSYDSRGNRTEFRDGDQVNTYEYDSINRLRRLVNHKGEVFDFDFDSKNRLARITRPGSTSSYTYFDNNAVKSIIHENNQGIINSFTYQVDGVGNITQKRTPASVEDYSYDNNDQLVGVSSGGVPLEIFEYDNLGNRISDDNGSYSYDQTGQRLTEDWKYLYYFDDAGNLSSKIDKQNNDTHQYIYNSENQLIGYQYFKQGISKEIEAFYTFDAIGRRVEKVINDFKDNKSKIRRFSFDGDEIVHIFNENNEILAKYTHSMMRTDDVLAVDISQAGKENNTSTVVGSYFFFKDHIGSVVDIVDNNGTSVQSYDYTSFGVVSGKNGKGDIVDIDSLPLKAHFTFTGREFDEESNLYHFRKRTYDPLAGRFLQVDPVSGNQLLPVSVINKYTYASNRPGFLVDPTGEFVVSAFLIGAAVGGLVSAFSGEDAIGILKGMAIGGVVGVAGAAFGALGSFAFGKGLVGTILSGALAGGGATSTSLALEGENPFNSKNIGKVIIGAVIGGAAAGVGKVLADKVSGSGFDQSGKLRIRTDKATKAVGEIYNEAAQKTYKIFYDNMLKIECAPFAARGDMHNYNVCMGL
ncbi:RHS repeat-associated core domain-containing protein [Halobacteriovorax sp. RZ-2]|uniref:RHS repeat-associated core domain-containing protein n=1 Tax=unclassified Halobacteriovorax TaxID=2639665 RepID=UPI00371D154F